MLRRTSEHETDRKITVDIGTLQAMLCVGRSTATQIGNDAGAVLHVGRRTLYNVAKIEKYLETLTEA